jgi:hypothetical protein
MPKKAKKAKPTVNQKELTAAIILAISLGLLGGYGLGYIRHDPSVTRSLATESTGTSEMHSMSLFNVPAESAPTVDLVVVEDAKSGYNIKIITTNFTFTPEAVNGENIAGEGHAHLYFDGKKITRAYGPYFHYDGNFEGTKTFSVELNANDHSAYGVDGMPIRAEVQVTHDSSNPEHNDSHNEM